MRWDLLDPGTQRVLWRLRDAGALQSFTLAGGSGLALWLGHRRSRDLDFFTSRRAARLNAGRVLHALEAARVAPLEIVVRQPDQLHLSVEDVRVTYVGYPFGFQDPPAREQGVPVASPADIAAMKAYAVGRRAVARDYVDLALVLERGVLTLADIIRRATQVFRLDGEPVFAERLFLQQLLYTHDLEDKADAVALVEDHGWSFERVEQVLRREVEAYVRRDLDAEPGGPPS